MPYKLSPRLKIFDYLGFYRYFLTICTYDRARIFIDDQSVDLVLMQLSRTAGDQHLLVIAYCFMRDHVHMLVERNHPAAGFREFVRIFKQRSSFAWKRTEGTTLWQRSDFEHVLRDDENTIGVAKYILENPLRANLTQRPEDYPYLGSIQRRFAICSIRYRPKADLKVRLYARGHLGGPEGLPLRSWTSWRT